jgi:hypothetical protein
MKRKSTQKTGDYSLAHVLYQKLGNDWYAFTEVDGDCFMSKLDAEVTMASSPEATGQHDEARSSSRKRRAA